MKGGLAAAIKPDNPVTVNPAAAINSAVATAGASKRRCMKHGTPANLTANNGTEPNPPTAVAVHPATANGANVPSRGGAWQQPLEVVIASNMMTLPYYPCCCRHSQWPQKHRHCLSTCWTAKLAPADGEITRIVKHAANTTSQMDTTIDTAISASGATTNPLPPDSDTLQKLDNTSTTKICPSNTKTQTVSTK